MVVAELVTKLGFRVDPRELDRGINQARRSMVNFKGFLTKLALGTAVFQMARSFVNSAKELETMNAQLLTMTGSAAKTEMLFKGVTDYAKQTSFYMKDALGATTSLLQGQVASGDILGKIRQLGDIASTSDQLQRLAMAYGRTNARGYMSGIELQRFQRGGNFNPLQQLALMRTEQAGLISKGEEVLKGTAAEKYMRAQQEALFDLVKKRKLSIEMVDQAIAYATSKGGLYFEHQKKQLQTFQGAYSNMLDIFNINAGLALMKFSPIAQKLMNMVSSIDMTGLPVIFEKIAIALEYIGSVIMGTGLGEAFEQLKTATKEYFAALGEMMGGQKGAGDALTIFGMAIGYVLVGLVKLQTAWVKFITMMAGVVGPYLRFLRIMWELVKVAWAAARAYAGFWWSIMDALRGANAAIDEAAKKFTLVQTIVDTIAGAIQKLNDGMSWMSSGPLKVMLTMLWEAVSAAYKLGEVLANKSETDRQQDINNRALAESEYLRDVSKTQRAYMDAHGGARNAEYDEKIAASKERLQSIYDERLGVFNRFAKEAARARELSEKTVSELGKLNKSNDKIAGNTEPRSGSRFDELALLNTALRGRLPDQLMHAIAEYEG